MIIAIGSTNPVKFNAVKKALKPIYPKAKFISVKADSKVKDQPDSIKETKLGAKNRSLAAQKQTKADLAVGLEGGVFKVDKEMFNMAWCAIVDKKGTLSFGGGMCFAVPAKIAQKITDGQEMGDLIDQLTNQTNVKQKGGAISIFTDNLTTRTQEYISLVKMAMAKFRRPDLYD